MTEAKKLGVEIIDRCNLTVLQEPGQEDLVKFLAANQVPLLPPPPPHPCYTLLPREGPTSEPLVFWRGSSASDGQQHPSSCQNTATESSSLSQIDL